MRPGEANESGWRVSRKGREGPGEVADPAGAERDPRTPDRGKGPRRLTVTGHVRKQQPKGRTESGGSVPDRRERPNSGAPVGREGRKQRWPSGPQRNRQPGGQTVRACGRRTGFEGSPVGSVHDWRTALAARLRRDCPPVTDIRKRRNWDFARIIFVKRKENMRNQKTSKGFIPVRQGECFPIQTGYHRETARAEKGGKRWKFRAGMSSS